MVDCWFAAHAMTDGVRSAMIASAAERWSEDARPVPYRGATAPRPRARPESLVRPVPLNPETAVNAPDVVLVLRLVLAGLPVQRRASSPSPAGQWMVLGFGPLHPLDTNRNAKEVDSVR